MRLGRLRFPPTARIGTDRSGARTAARSAPARGSSAGRGDSSGPFGCTPARLRFLLVAALHVPPSHVPSPAVAGPAPKPAENAPSYVIAALLVPPVSGPFSRSDRHGDRQGVASVAHALRPPALVHRPARRAHGGRRPMHSCTRIRIPSPAPTGMATGRAWLLLRMPFVLPHSCIGQRGGHTVRGDLASEHRFGERGARLGEQVALVQLAAEALDALVLRRNLHALGDDAHPHVPAQRRHRPDEALPDG